MPTAVFEFRYQRDFVSYVGFVVIKSFLLATHAIIIPNNKENRYGKSQKEIRLEGDTR